MGRQYTSGQLVRHRGPAPQGIYSSDVRRSRDGIRWERVAEHAPWAAERARLQLKGALLRLLAFRSLAEHVFHRRAYRFISTMNTTHPATRTALALSKVRAHPVDMLTSGFRHLRRDHPADPFIARKRCKALPCSKCHRVGRQGAPQIGWNAVHDTAGNTHLGDGGIIANLG